MKMAGDCDIEDERVNDHKDLQSALMRCKNTLQNGHHYRIDGTIEKRFDGKDSTGMISILLPRGYRANPDISFCI